MYMQSSHVRAVWPYRASGWLSELAAGMTILQSRSTVRTSGVDEHECSAAAASAIGGALSLALLGSVAVTYQARSNTYWRGSHCSCRHAHKYSYHTLPRRGSVAPDSARTFAPSIVQSLAEWRCSRRSDAIDRTRVRAQPCWHPSIIPNS